VQPEQDALEAGLLADEKQTLRLGKLRCFPTSRAPVIEAVGIDEQETTQVAARLPLALLATLQRSLDESQRIPAPQPRAIKINRKLVFIA